MSADHAVPTRVPAESYPSRAIVDLEAVRSNVRALAAAARPRADVAAQVMAVVKADAYGHGLVPCARAALEAGATWLGAAQVPEALALRAAGVGGRILTWLYAPGAPLGEALAADVDVSVASPGALAEVLAAATATGRVARVHIKVDTGLGRNGVTTAALPGLLEAAVAAQSDGLVEVVGIWSHLAFADEPTHPTVLAQATVFDESVRLAEAAGAHLEVRHLANSAATLTNPRMHYDLVRPGLAVYGLSPVPHLGGPADYGLVPAMTVEASLATVKEVPAAAGVSYAHAYTTSGPTTLGVVPLGYADGIPRHASGSLPEHPGGPVLVGSGAERRTLAVAGRVCMDQFVLDLGAGAAERAGDAVVLFGTGADGGPTAEDWARAAGTISYEITTRLGARVPREYVNAAPPGAAAPSVGAAPAVPVGSDDAAPVDAVAPAAAPPDAAAPIEDVEAPAVTIELADADATRALGRALAAELRAGDLVMLTGELGAGKTTLTQGIGAGLGVRGQVASPTFVIARVHPSLGTGPALVHVDAYRLGSLDEVDALDLDASLEDSVTVVEWGQGLVESLAGDRLEITIERPRGGVGTPGGDDLEDAEVGVRRVTLRGYGRRWSSAHLSRLVQWQS